MMGSVTEGPAARSPGLSVVLVLVTIAGGLAVRFASLGLPYFVVKYGGSMLWGLMLYWIVSAVVSTWRLPAAAMLAGVLATMVELLKLYHSPGLDAFRLTLPGVLLLGRFFSAWDIAAYWLAVSMGAFVDHWIRSCSSR